MATHTTTAGKVKVGLALPPDTYALLKHMAPGPRAVGALVDSLIRTAAVRAGIAGPGEPAAVAPAAAGLSAQQDRLEQHGERLQILHEIDRAILAAQSPTEIAEAAAQGLLRSIQARNVAVALRQPDDDAMELLAVAGASNPIVEPGSRLLTREGFWRGLARRATNLVVEDLAAIPDRPPELQAALDRGLRAFILIPLLVEDEPIGLLALARQEAGAFPPTDLALAQQIADSLAVAMRHARLYAEVRDSRRQLQALSRRLVQLQEDERRALSRDLHDTSGQNITALKLGLSSLKREGGCSDVSQGRVDELLQLADTVSEDLHRLAVNLRPVSLDRFGLVPALAQLLTEFRKQSGLNIEFDARDLQDTMDRLAEDTETALYRIVQEALTNIARYAQAKIVSVVLQVRDGRAQVIVEDDGRGFEVEAALQSGRLGLLGMRERAEMMGGTLEIESSPGRGTCIYASVPTGRAAEALALSRDAAALAGESSHEPAAAPDPRLAEAAELALAKRLSDALVDITAALAPHLDAGEILRLVLARGHEAIGRENAHVALWTADAWDLRYAYRDTLDFRDISAMDAPAWNWVAQRREVLVVDDTAALAEDDPLRLEAHHVKSYACVPLIAGDELLGVLSFVNYTTPAAFRPSEVAFLDRLSAVATLALDNARLRETEIRRQAELEAILSSIVDGLLVYDRSGRILRINAAAHEMLGYSSVLRDLPMEQRAQLTDPPRKANGAPFAREEFPAVRALQGEVVRDEEMVLHVPARGGRPLRVAVTAAPIRAAGGAVTGCVTTFHSVEAYHNATERLAQREAALRKTNAELEAVLAAIPDGLIVYDTAGKISHMNELALAMLGYPEATWRLPVAERVTTAVQAFLPDGSPLARDEYISLRALRGEMVRNENQFIHLPGNPDKDFWGMFSAGPIWGADGKIAGALTTMTDVSALHQANEELRRNVETLAQLAAEKDAILGAISDGLVIYGQTGDIVWMNRAANEILALTSAEQSAPVAQRAQARPVLKPDGSPYALAELPVVRALAGHTVQGCIIALPQPGGMTWVSVSAAPVRRPDGGQQGAVVTFTDITSLHNTQEALEDTAAELEVASEELQAQADELREAAEGLEQRVQERTAELEAIFASLPDAVYVGDLKGITRCNPVALARLGCASAEEVQQRLPEIMAAAAHRDADSGEPIPLNRESFTIALSGRPHTQEIVVRDLRTGQDVIQRTSANPIIKDGQVIGVVAVHTDITAQKRAAAQREVALRMIAQQGERLALVHEIDRAILAGRPPAEIAQQAVALVRRVTESLCVSVSLLDGISGGPQILAADSAGPATSALTVWPEILNMRQAGPYLVVPDVAALADGPIKDTLLDRGVHALTALPLVVGAEALGFLQLGRAQTGPLPVDLLEFATQVADSLAVAVHDARLHEQLRDSRGQLQALARRRAERQENDRRYIADQLFNEAGQVMAALKLQLGRFERGLGQAQASAETLAEIKSSTDRVLHDLHDLASRLRPISLDRLGLAAALHQYLVEFGQQQALQIHFAAPGMERVRVPDAIETALYRMTQEILANVTEHAQARSVDVVLRRTDDLLLLSIADDGVGFDVASELRHGGLGLVGLIEQAEALGGTLAIESASGAGTTITARIPLA